MIVSSNLIPRKAAIDAFHIAIATIHDMDIMLTWNCCHLANAELLRPLRLAMQARELDLPVICTQEELMGILKN